MGEEVGVDEADEGVAGQNLSDVLGGVARCRNQAGATHCHSNSDRQALFSVGHEHIHRG